MRVFRFGFIEVCASYGEGQKNLSSFRGVQNKCVKSSSIRRKPNAGLCSNVIGTTDDSVGEVRYKTPVAVPASGNQWIDGLIDGYRWGVDTSDPDVGYTFISDTRDLPSGEFGGYPSWGWNARETSVMKKAMANISSVCRLRFIDRGDNNDDNVEIWFYSLDSKESDDSFGFAYTPASDLDEGLVAINWSLYRTEDNLFTNSISPGSFYGITFLHELCHAVGLKHPHELGLNGQPRFPGLSRSSDQFKDKGMFEQNAHPFTQLSYVDKKAKNGFVPENNAEDGFLKSPGALDTAALQWMYGINSGYKSKDNIYRLPRSNSARRGWKCIWDTGGIDKIDGSKSRKSVLIDLRNATLGDTEAAGGYPSSVEGVYGGFTIAHDWNGRQLGRAANLCIIENAIGGKAGDRLIGNQAANELRGMRGDDVLYSGGGRGDRLFGGKGKDQFWIDVVDKAKVKVMDFSPSDRLVFNVSEADLMIKNNQRGALITSDNGFLAELVGFTGFSFEKHALFEDFDTV